MVIDKNRRSINNESRFIRFMIPTGFLSTSKTHHKDPVFIPDKILKKINYR